MEFDDYVLLYRVVSNKNISRDFWIWGIFGQTSVTSHTESYLVLQKQSVAEGTALEIPHTHARKHSFSNHKFITSSCYFYFSSSCDFYCNEQWLFYQKYSPFFKYRIILFGKWSHNNFKPFGTIKWQIPSNLIGVHPDYQAWSQWNWLKFKHKSQGLVKIEQHSAYIPNYAAESTWIYTMQQTWIIFICSL